MAKLKIIGIFALITAAAVAFQNCGKHNPGSVEDAPIATLGDEYVGKTYELYRVVHEDGSDEIFNKEGAEALNLRIFIRFDSAFKASGFDGCNSYSGDVIWYPAETPDALPEIEFFNVMSTLKACDVIGGLILSPSGSYFYDVEDDLFRLIEKDSSRMYEFAELQDLD